MADAEDSDRLFYLGAGPLAALLLGLALVPLRGFTTASNFTFAFLALTIVTAELGGRWAALATAIASALSLDFFMTQPYLRLAIADKHDAIAFFGLAACGLLAAALASQRERRGAAADASRKQIALVHSAVEQLAGRGPLDARLTLILDALRGTLPLEAAIVRDMGEHVLAASAHARGRVVPGLVLAPDTLPPAGDARRPVPREGARLALVAGREQVGWLDLWGSRAPVSADAGRALSAVARVVAALLAGAGSGAPGLGGHSRAE